jgi:hypothetical protein
VTNAGPALDADPVQVVRVVVDHARHARVATHVANPEPVWATVDDERGVLEEVVPIV